MTDADRIADLRAALATAEAETAALADAGARELAAAQAEIARLKEEMTEPDGALVDARAALEDRIAERDEAKAALAAARAEQMKCDDCAKDAGIRICTGCHEKTKAAARAVAFEEAKQWCDQMAEPDDDEDDPSLAALYTEAGLAIAALAPLPPGLVVLTVEQATKMNGLLVSATNHAHGDDCRGFDDEHDLSPDGSCECGLVAARACLAALTAAQEKTK